MRTDARSLLRRAAMMLLAVLLLSGCGSPASPAAEWRPEIPRTWDPEALHAFEVPLAHAEFSPVHVTPDYYYQLPERPIYRSYPVYAPGHEPDGYMEWLAGQPPEVVFDPATLKTEADWTAAGALVFDAPIEYEAIFRTSLLRNPRLYERLHIPTTGDGIVPFARYVVREPGTVELGNLSCAMCHTRVLDDGTVIKGAQGNFPFDAVLGLALFPNLPDEATREGNRLLFGAPWVQPNPQAVLDTMTSREVADAFSAVPAGVLARQGTSIVHPPRVPDLIGIRDRRYLDSTGVNRHHGIGDVMRYAALNQGMDTLSRYGAFVPDSPDGTTLPPSGQGTFTGSNARYSEAQLYALGLYLYSLAPPPNPNRPTPLSARGEAVFHRAGCTACHPAPLYTNNRLTPVEGFEVPDAHLATDDIHPVGVGTDPMLALTTRRGTGYYKVPSLSGVWYRGPFEHNGSVATLEDWFDPRRLRDDYVPTGYRGFRMDRRAVPGHRFGLDLSDEDKRALIAFLKTL